MIPTLKLTKKSLEDLYARLEKGSFSGLGLFPFESKIYRNVLDVKTEQQKISSELAIMTKALIKLENLYHYPEATMTETMYNVKKEQMTKEKERLNLRLSVLKGFSSEKSAMEKDIAVFNELLFSTSPHTPAEVFSKVNPLLLQEFMNRLLLQVDVNNKMISTLYLKNGLEQKFIIVDSSNA